MNPWLYPGRRRDLIDQEMSRVQGPAPPSQNNEWIAWAKDYTAACKDDFRTLLGHLSSEARFFLKYPELDSPSFDLEDSDKFGAHAEIYPNRGVRCRLSMGLFWGLDDLCAGIACEPKFFQQVAPTKPDDEYYATTAPPFFRADVRYCSYAPTLQSNAENIHLTGAPHTALTLYFRSIPVSLSRVELSQILMRVQLLWVMMHEMAHHACGHLKYYRDALDLTDHVLQLDEVGESRAPMPDKTFELMADRFATHAVLQIMTDPIVRYYLPPRFRPPLNMIYIVTLAIGFVVMVFDRARKAFGGMGSHPSVRTRLTTACKVIHRAASYYFERHGPHYPADSDVYSTILSALSDLGDLTTYNPRFGDGPATMLYVETPGMAQARIDEAKDFLFGTTEDWVAAMTACVPGALSRSEVDSIVMEAQSQHRDFDSERFEKQYSLWGQEYSELNSDQLRAWSLVGEYRLPWCLI